MEAYTNPSILSVSNKYYSCYVKINDSVFVENNYLEFGLGGVFSLLAREINYVEVNSSTFSDLFNSRNGSVFYMVGGNNYLQTMNGVYVSKCFANINGGFAYLRGTKDQTFVSNSTNISTDLGTAFNQFLHIEGRNVMLKLLNGTSL